MKTFLQELEQLGLAAATNVSTVLLTAYMNKSMHVDGAPAMTLHNIGQLSGQVAAATVLQHIAATQAALLTASQQAAAAKS